MKAAKILVGVLLSSIVLLPVANWAIWALIPPLSRHALAKTGHFVSVEGIDTYYERYGAGPPLILIPPGGAHTRTWRFNIDALSRSHEVWTFDLPGSGYTEKPATFPYTHRSYAKFVADFMTAMGIKKAVVVGQSLGGTVALEFALDFPDRTAGIVLIDAGGYSRGGFKLGALNPLRYPFVNAILMSFSSYPAVVKNFFPFLYRDPARFSGDAALVSETCNINRTTHARDAFYWMQRGLNFDFALPDPSRIRSVAVPTLIVWGREDKVIGVETGERFHRDIAGSKLVVVEGAGHVPHEEKPDAVNHAIRSFLDTLRW